jgi:hypothetical protein
VFRHVDAEVGLGLGLRSVVFAATARRKQEKRRYCQQYILGSHIFFNFQFSIFNFLRTFA